MGHGLNTPSETYAATGAFKETEANQALNVLSMTKAYRTDMDFGSSSLTIKTKGHPPRNQRDKKEGKADSGLGSLEQGSPSEKMHKGFWLK